jgi:hypothetical protein
LYLAGRITLQGKIDDESRSPVNIASTLISAFWCLLMMGMVVLALFLTFMR